MRDKNFNIHRPTRPLCPTKDLKNPRDSGNPLKYICLNKTEDKAPGAAVYSKSGGGAT
jgi:hypothetical protein